MTRISPLKKLPPLPTEAAVTSDSPKQPTEYEARSSTFKDQSPSDDLKPEFETAGTRQGRDHVLARALYSYTAETADEMSFHARDILEIFSDLSHLWWYARRRRGGRRGFIPCNYVVLINNGVSDLDAWFEVSRREAELLLLLPSNRPGTFILRPSSTGFYALSVKVEHAKKRRYYFVEHYKIVIIRDGGFYINPEITFLTMSNLFEHYREHMDGLCSKLLYPCPRERQPTSSLEALEVHHECLTTVEKFGNGTFSDIYLALWNKATPVVVKKLKQQPTVESDGILNEAMLLMKLCHPHVLQILGICRSVDPIYIVTELMVNGAVLDYLRKDNGAILTLNHLVTLIAQMAEAMTYLESVNIVHRDVRAANVLVGENNTVKLGDFGLARQLDESGIYVCRENGKFPAKWTPIEAAIRGNFSLKSDVWSFGILMWEIITYGGTPYAGLANREVLELVAKGYRMPNPSGGAVQCDQNLYHIMLQCWRSNPENRPTFSRLKQVLDAYVSLYVGASNESK